MLPPKMPPSKCRDRKVATEMSPPSRAEAGHDNAATTRRPGGGDDNSLAPAQHPGALTVAAAPSRPSLAAQASLLPLTPDQRGWVRIAVEVRTTRQRRLRNDDNAGESLQFSGALTVAANSRCPHLSAGRRCPQKLQCPGTLTVAAGPKCLHRSCSAQVPSQSLQLSSVFTVVASAAAAPTSLQCPKPSGALTVVAAAFPHRPHCSPSLKMGEDSGKGEDDEATTTRRRRSGDDGATTSEDDAAGGGEWGHLVRALRRGAPMQRRRRDDDACMHACVLAGCAGGC